MASSTDVNAKLVMKLNETWSLYDLNGNLIPLMHDPYWVCPRHAVPLVIHQFHAFKDNRGFLHIDVNCKCPLCDWFTVFGIALNKHDEDLLKRIQASKYHGQVLRDELFEILPAINYISQGTKEYVQNRIKEWGYW